MTSLSQVDFPATQFEILVVDNASTDRTFAAFEAACSTTQQHNRRYLYEPMPGLLSARHKGASESHGDVCVFIDDDVRLGKDWLNALQEAFHDPSVALAGGPSTPLFEINPPDWLARFFGEDEYGRSCASLSLFDGGEQVKNIHPCCVFGLNFAIRKSVLYELGGFNPDNLPKPLRRFQGDGETGLALKLQSSGWKALYHPHASIEHEVPKSRLNITYFEDRAFYQGICDSYMRIRAERKVLPSWTDPFRKIKRYILKRLKRDNLPLDAMRRRTKRSYIAGYDFHQMEVSRDSSLLAWVLRKDYWDYRLPEGWEKHLIGNSAKLG